MRIFLTQEHVVKARYQMSHIDSCNDGDDIIWDIIDSNAENVMIPYLCTTCVQDIVNTLDDLIDNDDQGYINIDRETLPRALKWLYTFTSDGGYPMFYSKRITTDHNGVACANCGLILRVHLSWDLFDNTNDN